MTDYKQLCAQLLEAYEILLGELRFDNRLVKQARAALADPEPPSLKEQALQELEIIEGYWDTSDFEPKSMETIRRALFELKSIDTIRRALEQLPDDQG
jgi:hypothetical protein